MSEAARVRESIDLEEFERRLRGPAPASRDHKSLDEFARMMASDAGGVPPIFAQSSAGRDQAYDHPSGYADEPGSQAPAPLGGSYRQHANAPQVGAAPAPVFAPAPLVAKRPPAFESHSFEPAPAQRSPAPPLAPQVNRPEFPQAYARDLQAQAPAAPQYDAARDDTQYAPLHGAQHDVWRDGDAPPAGILEDPPAAPGRSRKISLLLGGAIAVLVLGVGGTLATRSSVTGSGEAPTIKAASGPVKIQPEAPKAGDQTAQSASIFDRNGSERVAGSRVINREEQPIDIKEAARTARTEAPAARPGASPTAGAPAGLPTGGPASNSFFPEPRRVRTVSVRPDGSIIADPAVAQSRTAAASSAPAPTPRPVAAAPAPRQVGPAPSPPAAGAAPARPLATTPAAAPPKATVRAMAPVQTAALDTDVPPATTRPRADATGTATPSQAAQAGGSGPYAVQLGAPGSDAEARGLVSKAQARYGSALGGYKPTVRKATVGDKDVYRVRISGLSLEGANDLCGKLKASGGACFVARN